MFRGGFTFHLLRWPLLALIGGWITLLFMAYLGIRLFVAFSEWGIAWRGERKQLREKLRKSKTYNEWVKNAKALDRYLGFDKWKREDKFYYYDWKTLRMIVRELPRLRNDGKDEELLIALQNCLKSNFAGTENPVMYSQSYFGSKDIIEKYIDEVVKSLDYFSSSESVSLAEKRLFYRIVTKNFGKTALCLSGGACFAYNHFGIIKALIDNDCLPKVISGTSGGGLVAALAATRTNEELKQLINPQLADKITACEESISVWFPRWRKTGARFSSVDWARKCSWFTLGGLTFQEAFQRTGKYLNVSTVPADPHSPVILCNNITSPNCVIWSSLLASSAVPGILNPVVLMMKNRDNSISPFSFGSKWRDGSLRTDIPVDSLNMYYNTKFSIVSQVNPHISLFFFAPKGSVGRPVSRRHGVSGLRGGFLGTALENLIKLEIRKWLKLMKELDLLPHIMNQDWSNVWLQRFSGTITLWPKVKLRDLYYILSDPTRDRLSDMIQSGENSAFPKILFIKNRLKIERAIENGRKKLRQQLAANSQKMKDEFYELKSAKVDSLDTSDGDIAFDSKAAYDSHFEYSTDESDDDYSSDVSKNVKYYSGDEGDDEGDVKVSGGRKYLKRIRSSWW